VKAIWRLYREVVGVLPPRAQRFLLIYALLLGMLSVLDGLALAMLAAVITPLATGNSLTVPLFGKVEGTTLILLLVLVCALIMLKGIIAVVLLRVATRRFAKYELDLGSRLFDGYIRSPWVVRLRRNSADLVRLSDNSVATTIGGFILPGSTLLGECLTFLTLVVVLAATQPVVAAITIVYLGAIGVFLYLWVARRSRQAGQVAMRYSLKSARLITEMIGALKEVTLRNRTADVAAVVRSNRVHSTRARANTQFLSQVPRYVLDSGIIGGFVLVGVAGFIQGDLAGATTAVALFGVAGFRMAPSIVRFQAIMSQLNVSGAHASAVLAEIRTSESTVEHLIDRPDRPLPDPIGALKFDRVSFRYSPDAEDAVKDVSFSIPLGASVAFVGSSGAGKSTLVDLILGLIEPTAGRVLIDDVPLTEVTSAWRSRVAYVPQEVSLFDSTVAQNVALSWSDDVDRERVTAALRQAQLLPTILARPDGIDARIGERGLSLSGGQRQRLGIARALYAEPYVLVMDEATSALDTATEAAVADAIGELRGSMTIISVAHRLATIKNADIIFFMSGGRLVAQGTFGELVRTVPEFAEQASLAGLSD
jgi:ATP-binding cassette subfamily C protein